MTAAGRVGGRVLRRLTSILFPAIVASVWGAAPAGAQQTPAPPRVLVMPFASDARQATTYWLGEGAAVLVGDGLAPVAFTRDERIHAFEELHLPVHGTLSRATVIRVARLVGATALVFGNVTLDGQSVKVSARPLRLDAGQLGAEVVEQGSPQQLFDICARVAARLVEGLGPRVGTVGRPPAARPSLDAFEAYVKGLVAEKPDAKEKLLESALAKQPRYDRALVALWEARTERGTHERALAAARDVPESSPLSQRARFLASLSLIELKRYDAAFDVLKALADQQLTPEVLNNLGVIQLRRGASPQSGQATYYFNKAAEISPSDHDLFFNLGYAYWLARDIAASVYWLRESVRRDPTDGDAHYVLAWALASANAVTESARERELAERLSPKYAEWVRRAASGEAVPRGLERVKDQFRALDVAELDAALITAAQRDQRELAAFYVERARRLSADRRDGDAITELRRALFLTPYDDEALLLLGRAYLRAGQAKPAVDALRMSLWSEETAEAHVALGEALLESRDPVGARTEAERALAIDPNMQAAKALLERISRGSARR